MTDAEKKAAYMRGWVRWVRWGDRPKRGEHQKAGYDDAARFNESGGWRPEVGDAEEMGEEYLKSIEP